MPLTKEQLLAKRRLSVELDMGDETFMVYIKPVMLTDFLQYREELPAVYRMIAGTIGQGGSTLPLAEEDPVAKTTAGLDFMIAVVLAGTVEPKLYLNPPKGELSPYDLEPFGTGEGQAMPNLRHLSEEILKISDLGLTFRTAGGPAADTPAIAPDSTESRLSGPTL